MWYVNMIHSCTLLNIFSPPLLSEFNKIHKKKNIYSKFCLFFIFAKCDIENYQLKSGLRAIRYRCVISLMTMMMMSVKLNAL